jgi:Domain of unknown function (DUF4375)
MRQKGEHLAATRRSVLVRSCAALLSLAPSSLALLAGVRPSVSKESSMLLDAQATSPRWSPPSVIPPEDVLDIAIQPLRQQVQLKAQLAVSDAVKETSDIMALSRQMMQAGDAQYARHVAALPLAESRLHWLAWALEPQTDTGLAFLMMRLDAAQRRMFVTAVREAGIPAHESAATMAGLLPAGAVDSSAIALGLRARLEAIATDAGGRTNLKRAIASHLDNDPDARAFIAQARTQLDDETRVYVLFRSMIPHFDGRTDIPTRLAALNALPVPCRVVWLIHTYRSELFNGGVEQVFSNSSGILAPEMAAALRLLALDAHADVMERGLALFPSPYPRDARAWPAGVQEKLYSLGDDLKGEEIDGVLAGYARREGILPA